MFNFVLVRHPLTDLPPVQSVQEKDIAHADALVVDDDKPVISSENELEDLEQGIDRLC